MTISYHAMSSILEGEEPCGFVCRRDGDVIELYPSSDLLDEELTPIALEELLALDETLSQIENLPPLTQAWRWEEGAEFQTGRFPTGPTWFFEAEMTPGPDHPEKDRIGFAILNAWIRIESSEEAQKIIEQEIASSGMIATSIEGPEIHEIDDYDEDDEHLQYFEQAQMDGDVYLLVSCPKYPVFWMVATVSEPDTEKTCQAHFFLCADAICEEDDVFDPEFWNEERRHVVKEWLVATLASEGKKLISISEENPVGREDLPEELVFAYDDAEEKDSALVLIHEDGQK